MLLVPFCREVSSPQHRLQPETGTVETTFRGAEGCTLNAEGRRKRAVGWLGEETWQCSRPSSSFRAALGRPFICIQPLLFCTTLSALLPPRVMSPGFSCYNERRRWMVGGLRDCVGVHVF